jgi:hypothetical protein
MSTTFEITSTLEHPRYRMAFAALNAAGFTMESHLHGSKVVSPQSGSPVWMHAYIIHDDERILVRWTTASGVEVTGEVRINIDGNAAAFVAALASVQVSA